MDLISSSENDTWELIWCLINDEWAELWLYGHAVRVATAYRWKLHLTIRIIM